ncbi:gliding motility-associated C-terminal domain-containing protein [Salegentibacter mishustinae]|uniref:Ig-like domain-containing protein n=1 Tax=Salegentibacter mishustinae TaxID=270918 RepID=A0A0Q9ZIC8_9FLAO|nr:gliding motility-associated C-terminal domain-containing protein [Salegentibacter mishustinae]KRG28593.1 hypothetical protein APR42_07410 [Salegentibacter mishustinae]PNW22526.1 hypothetical protein APB85_15170 [Salegentibacter mishustinae]PZX67768.1 gliding motility-associated-like protein [Salegentibacter mishustinae]GGW77504.1 hypothetical protein GCM10008086_01110 [Salegentibacter mishustinae]
MQNFTFGRKGTNWFLFAFLLLIGTLPSFGQNDCPDLDNFSFSQSQTFCLTQTVSELDTDGFPVYQTDDNANDTQAIPQNELLADGETYFVGGESGQCERIAIEVTVNSQQRPQNTITNSIVAGFEFTTCTPANYSAENLANIFVALDDYSIEVYDSEESTTPLTGPLVSGNSYFVAQVPDGSQDSGSNTCPSQRVAVGFNPNQIEAPSAATAQTFCEDATVADLEAEGTYDNTQAIRWYRSQNGNSPLAPSTQLIDGQTYYAGQVVNERGSPLPPCETPAEDRVAVTVEVIPSDLTEETQRFCESIGEGNNFRGPEVQDLSPAGEWFADATSTEPLDPNTELVDEEDYFNRAGDNECSQLRVTADFFSTPNAGSTTQTNFCENAEPENLVDRINDSQLGSPDQTGTFSPALSTGTNIFNPADYEPGNYNFTYIVEGNDDCPTDTSSITVTVQESPNAGADVDEQVCTSDLEDISALITEFSGYLEGRDQDGTFDNNSTSEVETYNLQELGGALFAEYQANQPNGVGTYSYTYTVTNDETDCTDSSTIVLEISQSPNAGESLTIYLEDRDDSIIDLLAELGGDPGGTWDTGNGTFDPTTGTTPASFTYTITGQNECSSSATVTILDELVDCPEVTQTEQSFCESIGEGNNFRRPTVSNLSPANAVWYDSADSETALADDTILEDGETYFAGNTNGTCEDRDSVIVTLDDSPNAGATTFITVCSTDDSFDILDVLNPSILGDADQGGTISPALASGTTVFDPSIDTAGQYTYTVQSTNEDCPDDLARITIRVLEGPNAGENGSIEFTREDDPVNLITYLGGNPDLTGTWSPGNENGDFDPATDESGVYTYTVTNDNECQDLATVTVTFSDEPIEECPEVTQSEQSFCESIGEGNNFRRPTVSDLLPATAVWYVSADSETALASDTILEDGQTYFAGNTNGTCEERDSVIVTLDDSPNAGSTTSITVCTSDDAFDILDKLNPSILGEAEEGGTIAPALVSGTTIFDPSVDTEGQYTYTVQSTNETCPDDEAIITITIDDTLEADAGSDVEDIIVCSTDADINLFNYLSGDVGQEGYFEELEDGIFSPSNNGAGTFTFTFTVDPTSDCVIGSDSAIYSVEVLQGPNAGDNGSIEFSREDDPVNLINYLGGDPDEGGLWSPGSENGDFDPATGESGVYTYTVTNDNECQDSATVTVTFSNEPIEECPEVTESEQAFCESIGEGNESRQPTISDLLPANAVWYDSVESETALADNTVLIDGQTYFAGNTNGTCDDRNSVTVILDDSPNAGATTSLEVCTSDDAFDILDVLNPSILGEAEEGGTISPALASGTTIFDPSVDTEGQYTYTVSSTNDACPDDEAIITITFAEGANAGEDMNVTVCSNDDLQDLFTLISVDADMDGEFTLDGEVITDGIMDPSAFEAGTYEVVYTVMAEDDQCGGDDTATITITLGEAPEAPTTGDAVAFCAIDGATAALLDAEGTNLTWYSDADLSMMVNEEDLLVNGEYYVTQTADNGCESEAAMIMVNIVDSPAPTISSDYELCAFDNPTLADLTAEINETGEVTWYESADSMTALSNNAMLTDGTTYYATLISDNGCESSERLAVTVTLEDCALLFPEAITPNGDGRNDRLVIENIESEYPNYNITIFNRWGNAVYKGNASTPTWDGTSNQSGSLGDDVLPVGVYFYVVDFNDGSTEPRQGKVYLNR